MTDLSSWTAYFQDFGQFFNGFPLHPCPSDWILYPSHGFGHLLRTMSTSKTSDIENFGSHLCRILPKYSPLGAVCYRFYGLPLIGDHIIMIPIYWTAVLCVGLYHSAYIAEVIRSGIQSIP